MDICTLFDQKVNSQYSSLYKLAGVAHLLLMSLNAGKHAVKTFSVTAACFLKQFNMLAAVWYLACYNVEYIILFMYFSKTDVRQVPLGGVHCIYSSRSERCQNLHSARGSRESLHASAYLAFLKSGMKVTQMYFVLTHWFDFHCLLVFEHASHAESTIWRSCFRKKMETMSYLS